MTPSGDTFKTCARTGIAVNAFGLGATDAKQIGNFQLTDKSQSISLAGGTPVCAQ